MTSPSPLIVPSTFKRASSSASTSISTHNPYIRSDFGSSSPLRSSSPLLTPLHLTRRNGYTGWQANDSFDDLDEVVCSQECDGEDTLSCSCRARLGRPLPYMHQPLPSLMTKFADTLRNVALPPYIPSPFPSISPETPFSPGDGTVLDDGEEYDLESMDIHIHETYFATSAERGRWLSSPIAPRVRSQVAPMRAQSSPVKPLAKRSPSPVRGLRTRSCSFDKQSLALSANRDEDAHRLSSLPPSSPLSSPASSISFLGGDCEDDSVGDPRSNSTDCRLLAEIRESSMSPTACASLIESTCAPSPRHAPASNGVVSYPTDFHCDSLGPIISRHTSPCPSHSSIHVDMHVHSPSAIFESNGILSPPSRLDMDLSMKLPLSDTVNKPYPGLSTGIQDVLSSVQSPVNPYHEFPEASLTTVGRSITRKKKQSTRIPETRRTKKYAVIQSGNSSSGTKKRRRTVPDACAHPEPESKRSKLSHCNDDSNSCRAKRRGIPDVGQLSPSPSCIPMERCGSESASPRTQNNGGHAEVQQQIPDTSSVSVSTSISDVEFHASLAGMLVEAFATSRATSMDSLALYLVLTQAHPYLTAERSKKELLNDIATVLEAGRARCGMFEKVDSSGEKSRDKLLEHRWFYVAERDEDLERAALISAIMPRQKRKETKKYKQYYYQPLDKISRWDPEDAP